MEAAAERTALVSGGGGGIGAAVCRALARDGHRVIVADVRVDAARQTAAAIANAEPLELDVCDSDSVARAARATQRQPEILVNCAGWDELKPFLETDEAFWRKVIEINYVGTLRTTQALLPGMLERGYGRIVNIGSDAGRVGSSLEAVYSGAKGAVIAFTKTIAREVARRGVTANTVCPGPTQTPMLASVVGERGDAGRVIEAMTKAVPMRRLGQPEDVAAAVAFLASERAGFITGQTLSVSGGLTMA